MGQPDWAFPQAKEKEMAESQTQKLIAAGEFKRAAEWLNRRTDLSQTDRILRARIELEIGDTAAARLQAESLLQQHLEKRSRAYCLDIAGRALGRLGSTTQGLALMQKAISLAEESDSYLHAELLAHYARALLNWVGVEPALAVLPRLRRAALEAGNRRALVEYHLSSARVSAIRGSWSRAEAEIRLTTNLLEVDCCLDQLWRLRQVQSSMAAKACELLVAETLAEEALSLAKAIGSQPFVASTLANLAHVASIGGDFPRARQRIDEALKLLAPLSSTRFALYSTQIDVGLGSNDTEYAFLGVQSGEELSRELGTTPVYYQLWFYLHQVRWLLSQRLDKRAAALSSTALRDIESLADSNLLFRMRVLTAEALGNSGSPVRIAGTKLFSSLRTSELNPETLAEMNRIAAIEINRSRPDRSGIYLARASSVLSSSGLLGLVAGIERTCTDLCVSSATLDDAPYDLVSTVETCALALQLGKHPRALGVQIIVTVHAL